jgi:hypothetical protein
MAAMYSNGGNRWNILGFNFTKRDALSSVYKISMSAARVFLRFPKVSRHPSCMDHAILHGKPFGIPLIFI